MGRYTKHRRWRKHNKIKSHQKVRSSEYDFFVLITYFSDWVPTYLTLVTSS